MAPCEASELAAGKAVVEVGFGVTSASSNVYGRKKWIDGTIASAPLPPLFPARPTSTSPRAARTASTWETQAGHSSSRCRMAPGASSAEDRESPDIIGGSTAPRISVYTSVPINVAWAEKVLGLDLTPCHDANVGIRPRRARDSRPTLETALGSWTSQCQRRDDAPPADLSGTLSDADAGGDRGGNGQR